MAAGLVPVPVLAPVLVLPVVAAVAAAAPAVLPAVAVAAPSFAAVVQGLLEAIVLVRVAAVADPCNCPPQHQAAQPAGGEGHPLARHGDQTKGGGQTGRLLGIGSDAVVAALALAASAVVAIVVAIAAVPAALSAVVALVL